MEPKQCFHFRNGHPPALSVNSLKCWKCCCYWLKLDLLCAPSFSLKWTKLKKWTILTSCFYHEDKNNTFLSCVFCNHDAKKSNISFIAARSSLFLVLIIYCNDLHKPVHCVADRCRWCSGLKALGSRWWEETSPPCSCGPLLDKSWTLPSCRYFPSPTRARGWASLCELVQRFSFFKHIIVC